MSVATKKLTWDDIKDWPEYHGRTEIVDGQLVMSPVPAPPHQRISTRLGSEINPFVRARNLGNFYSSPLHSVLAEGVDYEPDLAFVSKGREEDFRGGAFFGPPDLIIEVISRSNRSHDTKTKFRHYQRYGVREYWMVDPDESSIEVWFLEEGKYRLLGRFSPGEQVVTRVLEGLTLDPSRIF